MTIRRAGLWLPCATAAKAPIPSSRRPSGPRASALRCSAPPAISAARPALAGLPPARLVGAEHRTLDDRAGLVGRRHVERRVEEPGDRPAEAACRPGDGAGGGAER